MSDLLPISKVRAEDVHAQLRRVLASGLDTSLLEEFLASIDWSGAESRRPAVADLLDEVDNLTTMYTEDLIGRKEYKQSVLKLLPASIPA